MGLGGGKKRWETFSVEKQAGRRDAYLGQKKTARAYGPFDEYGALRYVDAPFTKLYLDSYQRSYKIEKAYDLGKSLRSRQLFSMIID